MTFRATAGGLDAATTAAADARYLKLAADNDPLTGTLDTQALQPDTDATRNIGSLTARYAKLFATGLASVSGNSAANLTQGASASLIAQMDNTSGDGTVSASITGQGATFLGSITKGVAGTHTHNAVVSGKGATFIGGITDIFDSNNATVTVSGAGATFLGLARGFLGAASISVTGLGALVAGTCTGGTMSATQAGSGAFGFANSEETISCSGQNAWQLGVGTNSQSNSISVATGIRINGTAAPTTPRDGDLWVAATAVNIRTVGVNLNLNRPTVTGSRATGAALTDLLAKLAAMNLIIDSTTA